MDLAQQVADLAARLSRLETERAILQTLHRYGHSIDYGREADWLDCFTAEGAFDIRFPAAAQVGASAENRRRIGGQAALGEFIRGHTRAPEVWHKHLLIEPVIDVAADGRQASARSYFAMLDAPTEAPSIRAFGRYLDDLRLGGDGVWRFQERIAEIESLRP